LKLCEIITVSDLTFGNFTFGEMAFDDLAFGENDVRRNDNPQAPLDLFLAHLLPIFTATTTYPQAISAGRHVTNNI